MIFFSFGSLVTCSRIKEVLSCGVSEQGIPKQVQELVFKLVQHFEGEHHHQWRRKRGKVQRHVVVLESGWSWYLEGVQGQGQGLALLEGQQVRHSPEACQGVEVVVVDQDRPERVEGVQGERRHFSFLEGERLRGWAVIFPAYISYSVFPMTNMYFDL